MALQLIYTSAPRLLQAGRTGFGTVAAHPGIPSWLVGEIERASQFSRVPGLDSARVVLRHMIFGQGDRVHHVLSRIQDAGADYTGRTNHIAHHFVFTAAEAVKATELGVTPVDALAFLESHKLWQASWEGEPRPLGDNEILPVESIPRTITLPAETYWGALVPGRPECAAILAPGKTSEACWIVYPQGWGDAIVYAMGESLALHSNPWDVSFANDLQPTDNEQQIAWRGIPADSPLLPKAQSSVRPCIDLSNPNDLQFQPLPEYAEEARTGKKPLPKSLSAAPFAPKTKTASKNLPEPTKKRLEPEAITLLSKTNNQPRRNPYATPLVALLGTLLLSLGGLGGLWGYNVYTKSKEMSDELASLKSEITNQIPTQKIPDLTKFENPDELRNLSNFLKEILNDNITAAEESLKKINGISAEWNEWREVCNKLLDEKKIKDIETKKLDTLYAKACQGVALKDEDWIDFQGLAKTLHPGDKKWDNALKALKFIRNPDSNTKEFEDLKLNPEMPQDRRELYNIVLKKINDNKIKIYNDDISKETEKNIFILRLKEHLKDWPGSDQKESLLSSNQYKFLYRLLRLLDGYKEEPYSEIENFKSLDLNIPKFMESKKPENFESKKTSGGENSNEGELPKIYLTQYTENFKPQKPDKARHLIKKASWDQLHSRDVSTHDIWGEKQGATQFVESENGYMVFSERDEPTMDIPRHFVLNIEEFSKTNNASVLIVDIINNKLIIKKEFSDFLNRIYTAEASKLKQVFLSLNYKNSSYSKLNINKRKFIEPFKAEFQLNNPLDLVSEKDSDFNEKIKIIDDSINNIKNELNGMQSEKADFRFKHTGLNPWKDFRKKIDEIIKLDKKDKEKLKDFSEIYNRDKSHEAVEGFLQELDDMKNKEKFFAALSHFPEEQKSWFFFDDNKWSDDSRNKFKNQFGKDNFKKLEEKISIKNAELNAQNILKKSKEQERNNELNQLKTDQKATLNFYLDEADTEPFLTTEVTIPFRPQHEPPAVITKPPPPPTL